MSWLKTAHIQLILKLLSPHQYTKEQEVFPLLCLNKRSNRIPTEWYILLQQKNTNIPFKINLNFQILITGNINYILVQTSVADLLKYMLMGTTNKIPWLFPDFDNKIQTSLICNKIPLFPDSDRLKFPTFPWLWQPWINYPWQPWIYYPC